MKRRYKFVLFGLALWLAGTSSVWLKVSASGLAARDATGFLEALLLVVLVVGGLVWVLWTPASPK